LRACNVTRAGARSYGLTEWHSGHKPFFSDPTGRSTSAGIRPIDIHMAATSYNQKLWTAPTTQAAFLIPSTNTMPSTNSCSFALPFSFRQLFWAF
jgi:hypothetical protein